MKANRLAMAKKVNTLTTHLAVEVMRRTNLEDKITNVDNKYLDEKDKSTNERINRRMMAGNCIEELRKKQGEIVEMNDTWFEMSDEV